MFSSHLTFYGASAIYLSSDFLIHLLSTTFHLPSLHSEWLCWAFLLFAATYIRPSIGDEKNVTTHSDKLALAIAAVCVFRSIGGVDWALVCPCLWLTCPPHLPFVLIATTHPFVARHHSPSLPHRSSTRVSRKTSARRNSLLPWNPLGKIGPGLSSDTCRTVCGLASTSILFSMANLRRSLFRPHPHARLRVDPRTKRRTLVGAGRRRDISTLSCGVMAGFGCPDHDVTDCAKILLANQAFRASHLSRCCNAQVCTMGDGHGVG